MGCSAYRAPTIYSGGPIASAEEVDLRLRPLSREEFVAWVLSMIPENTTYRAHINAWWPERVLGALRAAGFHDCQVSSFQQSSDPELRHRAFDNRPGISLFVEARAWGSAKLCAGALRTARTLVSRDLWTGQSSPLVPAEGGGR